MINGTKLWITAAAEADWGLLFARTGPRDGGGITAFIIERSMPGISTKIPVIRSYSPFEVHFDNVEVPVGNRLGEENRGFAICQQWLVHARIPYATGVIGIAQAALALTIEWVNGEQAT